MNWLRKLFGARPAAEETKSEGGVLFGLDPPEGCHFRVSNHYDSSWHVRVMRGSKILAHECSLIGWAAGDDEKLIVDAAKRALAAVDKEDARAKVVKPLEGCYPPKNTNNKSAAAIGLTAPRGE